MWLRVRGVAAPPPGPQSPGHPEFLMGAVDWVLAWRISEEEDNERSRKRKKVIRGI
jgi:hypothetical protein